MFLNHSSNHAPGAKTAKKRPGRGIWFWSSVKTGAIAVTKGQKSRSGGSVKPGFRRRTNADSGVVCAQVWFHVT